MARKALGVEDPDEAFRTLERLTHADLEAAMVALGHPAPFNSRTKRELLNRLRRDLPYATPSAIARMKHEHVQGCLRGDIRERLEWAVANRAGYAGPLPEAPPGCTLEESQRLYGAWLRAKMEGLDDSPEAECLKREVADAGY
jgi:hypothetical protein